MKSVVYGHLEALQWLRTNGCPWNAERCTGAADGGRLEVLQLLRANGCPWDEGKCVYAAKGEHLEMLMWTRENSCPWCEKTCAYALDGGHPEILQGALANSCLMDEETRKTAAQLRYFNPSGRVKEVTPVEAAEITSLEAAKLGMLKSLHQRGHVEFKKYLCEAAVQYGLLKVLKWLRENGFPWDDQTCAEAAQGGHLEVLKWLRANDGCLLDSRTVLWAGKAGKLKTMQWALANGASYAMEDLADLGRAAGVIMPENRELMQSWGINVCQLEMT